MILFDRYRWKTTPWQLTNLKNEDKLLHFLYSYGLILTFSPFIDLTQNYILVFLIGLAKEIYDGLKGSGFCSMDICANLAGSALAASGLILANEFYR